MSAQEGLVAAIAELIKEHVWCEPSANVSCDMTGVDDAAEAVSEFFKSDRTRITSLESELAEAQFAAKHQRELKEVAQSEITRLLADNARQKQALEAIANLPGVDLEGSDEEVNERQAERASKAFDIARAALAGHEQAGAEELSADDQERIWKALINSSEHKYDITRTMTAEQMREAAAKEADRWGEPVGSSIAAMIRALPLASPGKGGGE